ncbi:MAG: hypothetical protein JWR02_2988 [Mucilaginibacter sp.]|nr:hypothetical protein [Mucilaginibacter sp.]
MEFGSSSASYPEGRRFVPIAIGTCYRYLVKSKVFSRKSKDFFHLKTLAARDYIYLPLVDFRGLVNPNCL